MALSSTATSVTYQGNGSTSTPYVIPFAFLSIEHIEVVVEGATEPPAPPEAQVFTITRNSDGQGGTVTSAPAITSASSVTITRVTPLVQPAVFAVAGPLPSKTIETAHDREVMQIQEINTRQTDLEEALALALLRIDALEDGIIIVPTAPVNTTLPVITGQPVVGSIISSSTGLWTGSPTGYTYQWTRNGLDIAAATAATYLLVTADIGALLRCEVTATNATGSTIATSAPVTGLAAPATSPRYYGISASTSLNEAAILALTVSNGSNRALSVTLTGGGQYIYYAYPASFGDLTTLLLNGLNQLGAFTKNPVSGTSTTVSGVAYTVYRSNNVQNGVNIPLSFA